MTCASAILETKYGPNAKVSYTISKVCVLSPFERIAMGNNPSSGIVGVALIGHHITLTPYLTTFSIYSVVFS